MIAAGDLLARFSSMKLVSAAAAVGGRFAVLAPHPDDESLGCGGMIAAACVAGHPPPVMILTDGAASHPGSTLYPPQAVVVLRAREAAAALAALGLPPEHLHRMGVPDGAAPHDAAGVARLGDRVAELAGGCDTLLVTWRHDPHGDHKSAYRIARHAAGRLGARLLEYPVWGWRLPADEMLPDNAWGGWRIDIAAELPAKRRAIASHRSQHGQIITDDPGGFVLPADMLALFDRDWEIVVEAA